MRVGMMVAAAAAVVAAAPAQAANWIRYTVTGVGLVKLTTGTIDNPFGYQQRDGQTLSFAFTVDADQSPSFFSFFGTTANVSAGTLSALGLFSAPKNFERADISATIPALGLFDTFPTMLGQYGANGTIGYQFDASNSVGSTGIEANGRINSIRIEAASSDAPYSFSYTFLPEPSTWALMVIGVGMLGAALRRRRPSVTFTPSPARSGRG